MTETVKQAPKAQPKPEQTKTTPKAEKKPNGPYIFDQPGPMFKHSDRPTGSLLRPIMTASMILSKLLLAAAVLSAFAKKETENGQATLTAGALGMTFMKTTIPQSDSKTDFDGKMILTETANEIRHTLAPNLTTEPLFNKNPLRNKAIDQFTQSLFNRD